MEEIFEMNNENNEQFEKFITKLLKSAKDLDEDFNKLSKKDQKKVALYLQKTKPVILSSFMSFISKNLM